MSFLTQRSNLMLDSGNYIETALVVSLPRSDVSKVASSYLAIRISGAFVIASAAKQSQLVQGESS